MLGIVCLDLDDYAVKKLAERTKAVVFSSPRTKHAQKRRFIYLADMLHNAVSASAEKFVIVRTNWIKELAESESDYTGAARAIDRVTLRFGAINIVTPGVFQAACFKMATLQVPRKDVIVIGRESVSDIIEMASNSRSSQPALSLDPSIINLSGSVQSAKTILVGERINRYLIFEHWPFFDDIGSAQFISHELEKGNIVESTIAWTNANHASECLVLQEILAMKPSLNVVALGHIAHEKLNALGIAHRRLAHPQHARRWGPRDSYSILLDQAIRG